MNLRYIFLAGSLVFMGCSSSAEKKASLLSEAADGYVSSIPHDTPYAFAASQPIPMGVMVDKMEGITGIYSEFLAMIEPMSTDPSAPESERRAFAVMNELSQLLTRQGMENAGINLNPRLALYGLGFFPALRLELQDPEAFQAFISRLENATGVKAVDAKLGQFSYRVFTFDDLLIPITYQGNTLVLGATHSDVADLYIPYLLGEKRSEKSLADSKTLSVLADKYRFPGIGLGFVSIQRIVNLFTQSGTDIHAQIMNKVLPNVGPMDPICTTEYNDIAANYPRIVFGNDRIDAEALSARVGLEMTNGLGQQLASTKTRIPGYESEFAKSSIFRGGVGLNIGQLSQVVIGKAGEVANSPFQCADLSDFNQVAGQIAAAGMFLPPMVSQITGASFMLRDIDLTPSSLPQTPDGSLNQADDPLKASGFALVSTGDAQGFFDSLKMLMPELAQFVVKTDGVPVRLTSPQIDQNLKEVYLAMQSDGLGVSFGGTQSTMADTLQNMNSGETPWISFAYDLSRLADVISGDDPTMAPFKKLFEHGELRADLEPSQDGLFVTYHQTFKK